MACEQDDLSELWLSLDEKDEGPSNDGDNDWEPELEPKHKIFLSYSGAQKKFTEQLCEDMERCGYYPFFDKRPNSLQKGKKIPELIFQAARQCHVAIFIVCEDFFTHSKWPMLELEAVVQSQKNNPRKVEILPVYLGLSRKECTKNEARRLRWLSVWREWAENDSRIDVGKWEDALKVFGSLNGIEYVQSMDEVALREQIVSAIRRLVPPESTWTDAHVQGRTQICKEPLSNILMSLTDQGRLLIDSLIQWFQIHIFESYGHQEPPRHKWRVNSRDLKTNRFLGQGFSGIIYETTWLGREYLGLLARKDFPVVNGDVFENEAARLVGLGDHPNIVKSLCWTIDRRSCSLVMEHMRYDLYSVVQKKKGEQRKVAAGTFPPITSVKAITFPFDLLTSIHLILQIATGMMHLHDREIAHGDLKPNNILVSSETSPMLVKVVDFGLNETKRRSTTLVSSRARCLQIVKWKAPELFEDYLDSLRVDSENLWTESFIESDIGKMVNALNSGVSNNAGMRRADIYSFALTCSYILGVQTWDPNLSWIELRKHILCGLRPQLPSGCPRRLASLISSCWATDPMRRPTFISIYRELQGIMSDPIWQAACNFLGAESSAGLGVEASDWEAQKSLWQKDSHRVKSIGSRNMQNPAEDPDQGGESAKRGSILSDSVDLPSVGRKHSQGMNSIESLAWKPKDALEVESFAKPAPLTPISDDGSVESLPGVTPKKPSWSTWAKGACLGSGTFGTVYEGVGSNGMFFAVKEVFLSDQGQTGKQAIRQLEQEIALLSEIQHPNIVQYLGTERDDEKLYIFQELVIKGSLAHVYEKYKMVYDEVWGYTKQILSGLKYLHDRKIIHRNIKCANILVDASGVVKLVDYGMAQQVDKLGQLKSFLGSALWMAPEVVNPWRSYDLKADIWSLGCTVLEMTTGKPPFGDLETHGVLWKVGHGESPPVPDDLEEDLKSFIANCLEVNVESRPTCDLLLTHPFITGVPMNGPVKLVATPELPSIAEEQDISAVEGFAGLVKMAKSPSPACRVQAANRLLKFVEVKQFETEIMQEAGINALMDLLNEDNVSCQKDALLALYHLSQSIAIQMEQLPFQIILAFLHSKWPSNVRDAAVWFLDLMLKENAENAKKFMETPEALKAVLYCLDKDAENPSSQKCASALLKMATEENADVRFGIACAGLSILVKFVRKHGTVEHKELLATMLGLLCKSETGCEEAVTKASGHTFLLESLQERSSKEVAAQGLLSLVSNARTRGDVLQAGFVEIAMGSIDRVSASTEMALGLASICSTPDGLNQIVACPRSVRALLILLERCPTSDGKGAAAAVIAKLYPRLNSNEDLKRQSEMTGACSHLIKYIDQEDKSQFKEFLKALAAFATVKEGRQTIKEERGLAPLIRFLKKREIDSQVRDLVLQILAEMCSVFPEGVKMRDSSYHKILNVFLDSKIGELLCPLPYDEEFKRNTESMKNLLILIRNLSLAGPACVHLSDSGAVPMLLNVLKDHCSSLSPVTDLVVRALGKFMDDPNGRKAFLYGGGIRPLVAVLKLETSSPDVKNITTIILASVAQDPRTGKVACNVIFSCDIIQALNKIMYEGETNKIKWQAAVLMKLLASYGPTRQVCAAIYHAGTLEALNYLRSQEHCASIADDILRYVRGKNGDCRRYIDGWS